MFSIEIVADKFKRFLEGVVPAFEKSASEELQASMLDIQRQMQAEGKPVTYPIQWDSDKQRRFVMAKLSEEGNLPYQRTGAYQRGWKVTSLPNGFALTNQHPAGAIGGTLGSSPSAQGFGNVSLKSWQSKIHRGRWPALLPVVLQAIADLPRRVIDRLTVQTKDD